MNSQSTRFLIFFALATIARISGFAQTNSVFENVAATGTLTVVGTTTLQGNAFSVAGATFVVSQGLIGIGVTNPETRLHIAGDVGKFLWFPSSAALRSGVANASQWNPSNIGALSTALGRNNTASGRISFVGGGEENAASGTWSAVGAGRSNTASAASFVAAGEGNSAINVRGFVGGGMDNEVGGESAIGAGLGNNSTLGGASFIGAGRGNVVEGDGAAILAGGVTSTGSEAGNLASGFSASVLGGIFNTASGDYSSVLGGSTNTALGRYSVAAGHRASAAAQGSFVFADSQDGAFTSSVSDEFKIRAQGGFVLVSAPAGTAPTIIVSSGALLISTSPASASAMPSIFISSTSGNVGIGLRSPGAGLDVLGTGFFRENLTIATTVTIQGALFSVGTSSFVVRHSSVAIGTSSPQALLDVNGSAQFGGPGAKSTFASAPGGSTFALTTSSGVKLSNGGYIELTSGGFIQWADGTRSTTAASGSSSGSGGKFVQFISSMTNGKTTITSNIPQDDTLPTSSEGAQILEATITPNSTSNTLLIQVVVHGAVSESGFTITGAVFQDSGASAIAVGAASDGGNSVLQNVVLTYAMAAGTTSATTFKLRVGGSTGTMTLNGRESGRLFGGGLYSSITITELQP